jgi:hypothetical protein
MFRTIALLTAVLIFPLVVFSQTIDDPNLSPAERLERDAVQMLRETQTDVEGLRLPENRISFASELASLMWFHDEDEARRLYATVINDFRQLLSTYDSQMNQYGVKPVDESESSGPFFFGEPSERQKVERKFRTAINVRQSIATSMAEHDPELALNFFYDSLNSVSNPDLRKQMEVGDKSFEQRLLQQVAMIDPEKAAQIAKKTLERGFNQQHIDALKKLYDKDADKAADLGSSLLSRIKSEKLETLDLAATSELLKFGTKTFDNSRTTTGKRAVYSDSELRELADVLAQAVLARPSTANVPYANYASVVERFQPGRAIQLRAKVQNRPAAQTRTAPPPRALTTVGSGFGSGNSNSNPAAMAAAAARAQREQSEKKMFDDVAKIGSGRLTAEQQNKIIQQARTTIMSMPGRDKRVMGLCTLAAQVAKSGDKELAADLMRDALSMVSIQPKNYQDFMLTWMLATGYASVDPDKAFPILEEVVSRGNDLIEALVRVGEFIDVAEEIISDGEFQVGAFGGSMVREITKNLSMADSTIQLLSKANFQKLKDLTNRFGRPEVRVLAKVMVLRAVLNVKKPTSAKTLNKISS